MKNDSITKYIKQFDVEISIFTLQVNCKFSFEDIFFVVNIWVNVILPTIDLQKLQLSLCNIMLICVNKMKTKTYHAIKRVPKVNRKIVDNTQFAAFENISIKHTFAVVY